MEKVCWWYLSRLFLFLNRCLKVLLKVIFFSKVIVGVLVVVVCCIVNMEYLVLDFLVGIDEEL